MLKNPARFYSYRPAAYIKVTGEDAYGFLQGQFTNELRQENDSVAYGLWLNQKGRVLADSHILRQAEKEFVLVSTTSSAAIIRQRLEEYIVADDVALVDETAKIYGLAVWGAGCSKQMKDLLGTIPASGQFWRKDQLLFFTGLRIKGESYEIIGPGKQTSELRECFIRQGFTVSSAGNAEVARLADGIPAIPQDIGPGDLPHEGGLEHSAISYTKGCYLGQEIMARLRNRGQVRRHLRVLRGAGTAPQTGTPLYQKGKKAGEIRSTVPTGDGFIAMAMLTRSGIDENAGFCFAVDGPVTARI